MKAHVASSNRRCHSNAIGAAGLIKYLGLNGVELSGDPAACDIVLLNTCGSLEDTRLFSAGRAVELSAVLKPGARLFTLGCLNKIDPGLLEELRAAGVKAEPLADGSGLDALISAKVPFREVRGRFFDSDLYDYLDDDLAPGYGLARSAAAALLRLPLPARLRAKLECAAHLNKFHVMIGSGCAGSCSYCAIKLARGAPVSRPIEEILEDIAAARRPGKTLNLVADDCGSYGLDTGSSLPLLLSAITERFPGLPLDLRYLNPVWLAQKEQEYLEAFAAARLNSVNVCMQSGSGRILRDMNRRYDPVKVLAAVDRLGRELPGVLLRTHFITGFPGETWGDFRETLSAAGHFQMWNTYRFSPLPGQKAPAGRLAARLRKVILDLYNLLKFIS